MTTASLAYRNNTEAIWKGRAPDKYLRLLPYITGQNILEIGAAEGVLSLLLADRDPSANVTALELRPERHLDATALQRRWLALGRDVEGCRMVCGDIRDHYDLLNGIDTLVAVRTIYHLRDSVEDVFEVIAARRVPKVVLVGNPNRARWPDKRSPKLDALGAFNRYAGIPGMRELLEGAGYTINTVVTEGDPIVSGHR